MTTFETLNECLMEIGHPAVDDINSNFRETIGLDSLEWLEFVVLIEDKWTIEIPEEDYDKLKTVKDAVDYIDQKATSGSS